MRSTHSLFQSAVNASNGQRRIEMFKDFLVVIGIAKEHHFFVRRNIVVERQPTTIGNIIVRRVKSHFLNDRINVNLGLFCCSSQLVEH